ncbi:MAG TPA: acyl-CoA dehydrogenase, partial [Microbacterium sp.]|nr:acyl-CoA dehydrogenase [Microbacterium sp.]
MDHTPVPGERVAGYDVSDRLGTDYYAVFADIPNPDRAVWERAKGFIDEALPHMDGLWDRGE